ncbi:C-type lectin domain family 4 member M-like [Penaeus chinensis]|uniref:C-type lectin domain family 4 member M-like n=1 Tax=Penaeus chinensis TaxID=139456 RepID=UPI001FB59B0C|nr:C-type lectin domain family 4 member M-like [Penaeus chinensis]
MKCVPPASSLTPAPGSQIYLMTGTNAVAYGSIMVPPSYSMACTFAYRIYDKVQLNYSDAETRCQRDRARLIAIKTPEQQRIMTGKTSRSEAYWIGLDDRATEGDFVMSDGTKPTYLNWDSGQPNNYIKFEKDQDCAMLFQGTWNDNQCDQMLRFICEIPFLEF